MEDSNQSLFELKEQTVKRLVEAIDHCAESLVGNPELENQIKYAEAIGTLTHAIEVITY